MYSLEAGTATFTKVVDVGGVSHWINVSQIVEIISGNYHAGRYVISLTNKADIIVFASNVPAEIMEMLNGA